MDYRQTGDKRWVALALVSLFLVLPACGGGGGGGGGSPDPPAENSEPVAVNDTAVTTMNTLIDIDVLANDSDPDGDELVVTATTPAAHGTVSINVAGTVRYVPATDYTGSDSFSYSIGDGQGGTATASVAMTVAFPAEEPIERVSVATDGTQGNADSWMGFSSADGRYAVFGTAATNLFPGLPSGSLLLRDRLMLETTMVSGSATGTPGNQLSQQPAMSGDSRFISFSSFASNLVPGDTNAQSDVFIKDLQSGAVERVSVASGGAQGSGGSFAPSLSTEGRYVAFVSMADNFFPGDSMGSWDIFVRDRQTGETEHIDSGGNFDSGPSLSGDGRYVAYAAAGQIYVYDRQLDQRSLASVSVYGAPGTPGTGASDYPTLSADGQFVAFTSTSADLVWGDANGYRDVFVRNLQTGTTTLVSVASSGLQGNGDVSDQERPGLSGDGRFVAFTSIAYNLVAVDTNGVADVFVHDLATRQTRRVSVSSGGIQANGPSGDNMLVSMSANGTYVVFSSAASNLVTGDTNGFGDVFIAPNPLAP